jgi:hypothetical protein
MRHVALFSILFAAAIAPAIAQESQVQNDCFASFGMSGGFPITAVGTRVIYSNMRYPCYDWRVLYFVDGFSAVSLKVDAASDSSGSPGAWSTFPGTPADGVNPNTSAAWAATRLLGAPPWISVVLTSASGSGSITGVLYGCKQPGCSSAGNPPASTSPAPCPGTVSSPCVTAAESSAGAVVTDFVCDQISPFTITGSGLNQIIAATTGKTIHLCYLGFSNSAGSNVTIESGTGTNCAGSTVANSGTFQNVSVYDVGYTPRSAPKFASGSAVCLNMATSVTFGGWALYAVF